MADGVARSPSRLCSRDGKICCPCGDALSTSFSLAYVPCFLLHVFRFSFLIFFPASRYVYLLRVPSSVQQPSATLSKYLYVFIVCVLPACVICTLPHLGIPFVFVSFFFFFFRSSYLSGGVFFVVLSYPVL